MGRLTDRYSSPYMMLRAWIIVWMLAVPLFHVHPEADHHHGEAGHVHSGAIHTVFSPDLDGEYDAGGETGEQPTGQTAVSAHPAHASDYTELGFSFVSDKTDRHLSKPLVTSVFLAEPPAHSALTAHRSILTTITVLFPLTLLTRDIPSRAPPALLV